MEINYNNHGTLNEDWLKEEADLATRLGIKEFKKNSISATAECINLLLDRIEVLENDRKAD